MRNPDSLTPRQATALEIESRFSHEKSLLEDLRQEISDGDPQNPEMARTAYFVSRMIGDELISDVAGADSSAKELIDRSRPLADPQEWYVSAIEGVAVGLHNGEERYIWLDHDKLLSEQSNNNIKGIAEAITLKHPDDARLLAYLEVAAHESGHAMLSGISKVLQPNGRGYRGESPFIASSAFIQNNPQVGFTGDKDSDAAIHEERFAEGFGRAVASRAMHILGYDKKEIKKVMETIRLGTDVGGKKGKNQLDYLRDKKSIPTTAPADQITFMHPDAREGQKYLGELGYAMPLSLQELTHEVKLLAAMWSGEVPRRSLNSSEYGELVRKQRGRQVTKHLKQLFEDRDDVLNPKRVARRERAYKTAGAAIIAIAAGSLGASAGMEYMFHKDNPHYDQVTVDYPKNPVHMYGNTKKPVEVPGGKVEIFSYKGKVYERFANGSTIDVTDDLLANAPSTKQLAKTSHK